MYDKAVSQPLSGNACHTRSIARDFGATAPISPAVVSESRHPPGIAEHLATRADLFPELRCREHRRLTFKMANTRQRGFLNRCGISRFLRRMPLHSDLSEREGGRHVTLDAVIGVPSRPCGGKARPWPAGILSRRDQATSAGATAGRPRTHWNRRSIRADAGCGGLLIA